MNEFRARLEQTTADMDLPLEVKRLVIAELLSDLQGMRDEAIASGMSKEQAIKRALEFVDDSPEAISDLARVHGTRTRKLLEDLGPTASQKSEQALLVLSAFALFYLAIQNPGDLISFAGLAGLAGRASIAILAVTFGHWIRGTFKRKFIGDERASTLANQSRNFRRLAAIQIMIAVISLLILVTDFMSSLSQSELNSEALTPDEIIVAAIPQLELVQAMLAVVSLCGSSAVICAIAAQRAQQASLRTQRAEDHLIPS